MAVADGHGMRKYLISHMSTALTSGRHLRMGALSMRARMLYHALVFQARARAKNRFAHQPGDI
jgi:hypothetical protein